MAQWRRIRSTKDSSANFFKAVILHGINNYYVNFVNMEQWDEVAAISIRYYEHAQTGEFLSLEFTINFGSFATHHTPRKLLKALTTYLPGGFVHINARSPCVENYAENISFRGYENFKKFVTHLRDINKAFDKKIFSDELISEIERIGEFCSGHRQQTLSYSHTISLIDHQVAHPHSLSARLINIMQQTHDGKLNDKQFQEVKSLLTQAEGIDEIIPLPARSSNGSYVLAKPKELSDQQVWFTPLVYAVRHCEEDVRLIAFLLKYRADPIKRLADTWEYSAYDYVRYQRNAVLIELFKSILNYMESPLSLVVDRIKTEVKNNELETLIDWKRNRDQPQPVVDSTVTTLKQTVTGQELDAIITFSRQAFSLKNDASGNLLISTVLSYVYGENSFKEIIRNKQREIIGFTIYKLIFREQTNEIFWYCSLAYIKSEANPEQKKPGLIQFLNWRHAFALQVIYPGSVVRMASLYIHPNTYKFLHTPITFYQHFPMYQSAHMMDEIHGLLHLIEPGLETRLHQEGITCYVTDDLCLLEKSRVPQNFMSDFFFEYMVAEPDKQSSNWKAVPVVVDIADMSYRVFLVHCSRLKIDFLIHVLKLAGDLKSILNSYPKQPVSIEPAFKDNCLRQADLLFWENISKPSDQETLPALTDRHAKL